ncbi:MAG TPA: hypothetical protein PL159_01830 [Candidatus Paceibacterota bacterium]|jgi:hypothetical protein|nr:hypothetical protein [Candidatus Paceibacterota bacterium]HPN89433.1 hypothetical protein [Candidatus Paceibacterota bacterium]
MLFRFGASFILIVSAIFFPWWLNLILLLIFIFSFHNFYEAVIGAILFDILRYQSETIWPAMLVTVGIILLVYLSEIVKQQIVFYH